MNLDEKMTEFIRRIGFAQHVIKQAMGAYTVANASSPMSGAYESVLENLTNLAETARQGRLPRQSAGDVPPGAGLGIGKSVGEWCDDENILDALGAVETYYRTEL